MCQPQALMKLAATRIAEPETVAYRSFLQSFGDSAVNCDTVYYVSVPDPDPLHRGRGAGFLKQHDVLDPPSAHLRDLKAATVEVNHVADAPDPIQGSENVAA